MKNIRFKIIIVVVFLVLILLWQLMSALRVHRQLTNVDSARKAGKAIPVKMVEVKRGSLNSILSAECLSTADENVVLSTDVGGRVLSINVRVGDHVSKKQLLLKLEDEGAIIELGNARQAQSILNTLLKELEPYVSDIRKLKNRSLVPVSDLLDAIDRQRRAELDMVRVKGDIYALQERISNTTLAAPIDSIVTKLNVSVGNVLKPNVEILTLSRLDPLRLECDFQEDSLLIINNYDTALASFPAHYGKSYPVEIEKVLPFAKEETHAVTGHFKLANKELGLLPGMRAVVRLGKQIDNLKIPSICLANQNGNTANVFIVDKDNIVHLTEIVTGRYAEGFIEVASGLDAGQRVVVVGQLGLQDGDTIVDGGEYMAKGLDTPLFPANGR